MLQVLIHLFVLKAKVDKLEINELVKAPIGLHNFKAKVVDLGKLKTVPKN